MTRSKKLHAQRKLIDAWISLVAAGPESRLELAQLWTLITTLRWSKI
jgi:hypothetical protein